LLIKEKLKGKKPNKFIKPKLRRPQRSKESREKEKIQVNMTMGPATGIWKKKNTKVFPAVKLKLTPSSL